MDFILWFIFDNVVRGINVFKRYFLYRPNYKVLKAELEYVHEPVVSEETDLDPLWVPEQKYWDEDEPTVSFVNITKYAQEGTVGDIIIPESIEQCLISLWYLYNDKSWRFFTRDLKYKWPPDSDHGVMKFTLPIKSAHLLNENKEEIYDVTGKIKKYAGPFNNFFNQEISPYDMLGYDYKFNFLKIVNLVGREYVVACDNIIRVPW